MIERSVLRDILREAIEKGRSIKKIAEALDIPQPKLEVLCSQIEQENRELRETKIERTDERYLAWKRAKDGARETLNKWH